MNKNQHLTQMGGQSLLPFLSPPDFTESMSGERFLVYFPKEIKLMQSSSAPTFRPPFNPEVNLNQI